MAILTGTKIKKEIEFGHIRIGNFDEKHLQPNSYDLTLDNEIKYYLLDDRAIYYPYGEELYYLSTTHNNHTASTEIGKSFILIPNKLYLVQTRESVYSDRFVPEISGVSSLARLGMQVHQTAGYANLGHEFKWVLEIHVIHPIEIHAGMKIAQMYFHTTYGENSMQYHGKYENDQLSSEVSEFKAD
jgi:dCTP deaminase